MMLKKILLTHFTNAFNTKVNKIDKTIVNWIEYKS